MYKGELDGEFDCSKNVEVMVRVFGEGSDQMLDRVEEVHVMRQVIPDYVKCTFDNGYVVTFFPGECLRPLSLVEVPMMQKVAARMAYHHTIVLQDLDGSPSSKNWFFRVDNWLALVKEHLPDFELVIPKTGEVITVSRLVQDLATLKKNIGAKGYEKFFCHGDVNAENCIYNAKDGDFSYLVIFHE